MINICMLRPVNIEETIPREKKEYKISFFLWDCVDSFQKNWLFK